MRLSDFAVIRCVDTLLLCVVVFVQKVLISAFAAKSQLNKAQSTDRPSCACQQDEVKKGRDERARTNTLTNTDQSKGQNDFDYIRAYVRAPVKRDVRVFALRSYASANNHRPAFVAVQIRAHSHKVCLLRVTRAPRPITVARCICAHFLVGALPGDERIVSFSSACAQMVL